MARWDAIVVGSGFGGSVSACRIAEKGGKVLVLERGRRWKRDAYPREPGDGWFWDVDEPHRQNGMLDLRFLDEMIVAQAAGVGGGSLIYGNVFDIPSPDVFDSGWPPEITFDELKPYYAMAGDMLKVATVPDNQLPPHTRLLYESAERIGVRDRLRKMQVAVTFDPEFDWERDDPNDGRWSKRFTNEHGVEQGTCVHVGNCIVGCEFGAKNTLDTNYLAVAESKGAEIRPLHLVRYIEPIDGGYRVHFQRLDRGDRAPGYEDADRVVLAAASLNTTEILLRSRDEYRTLPNLSPTLGVGWGANGDFISMSFRHPDHEPRPTKGVTIGAGIDFSDGARNGHRFYVEDGGSANFLGNLLVEKVRDLQSSFLTRLLASWRLGAKFKALEELLEEGDPLDRAMMWFASGTDAHNGRLYLGRRWYAPWRRELKLDWEVDASKATIDEIEAVHRELAESTGGTLQVLPTWRYLADLITSHPLGGCRLGTSIEDGVVDHRGEVFGYPNLFVADGSLFPTSARMNPSRTITALAERINALME